MASVLDILQDRLASEEGRDLADLSRYVYWPILTVIFLFAYWVRAAPAKSMEYLQALDPYMIARMSAAIAKYGHLPAVDMLRYFPWGTPTYMLNLGNIFIPAYFFSIARVFGVDFLTWAKLWPALIGALAVVPVYLLGAELFDRKTGTLSAFFLATSVAIMQRSSAGWFDKEPIANFLMLCSMYLFVRAWNRTDWKSGIGSGVFLAVAATSWGGAQYLYLLYPLVAGALIVGLPVLMLIPMLMIGKGLEALDVYDDLAAAFVPMAILASFLPVIMSEAGAYGRFPNKYAVLNLGVALFILVRYGLEKYDVLDEGALPYATIGMTGTGLLALLLAPLYSQRLAGYVSGVIGAALQTSTGVIGGTVAENAPASIGQVVSRLGASFAAALLPGARYYSEFFSGWTMGLIGLAVLSSYLVLMVVRRYSGRESVDYTAVLGLVVASTATISLLLFTVFQGSNAIAFVPAVVITSIGCMFLFLGDYLFSEEFEQWVGVVVLLWAVLLLFTAFIQAFIPLAVIALLEGLFLMVFPVFYTRLGRSVTIRMRWEYLLVAAWVASTVYGATQKSRLLFLASTPVAFVAGIGVSKGIDQLLATDMFRHFVRNEEVDAARIGRGVSYTLIVALLAVTVAVNASAVYVMGAGVTMNGRSVGGIGGSPNSAWMQNLEYMREETPPGSVILSWWDYGYWFETIGNRAAAADGGNMGYYATRRNNMSKINFPLAKFLTASNASSYRDFLRAHSVDYIVLDSTMIGKYSAVSQIAHQSNTNFNSMRTLDCKRSRQQRSRCQIRRLNNQTVIPYRFGRGTELLVPVARSQRGLSVAGPPLIRTGQQVVKIEYFCSGQGLRKMTQQAGTTGGFNAALRKALRQQQPFGGCVAFHPARGLPKLVIVPPNIMRSTLVRLYLMNGAGIEFVEREQYFGNGFVKMWEVTE
ncbi:MAG: STT3 domain-containing protein [Candidatus Nanohaloarchaea archaeon]|nr:STT3 domain-containing protein [Candidatus Nanohaloarchaea archaeon]